MKAIMTTSQLNRSNGEVGRTLTPAEYFNGNFIRMTQPLPFGHGSVSDGRLSRDRRKR